MNTKRKSSLLKGLIPLILPALLCLMVTGCGNGSQGTVIRVWSHQGQAAENKAMRAMADAFNEAHADDGLRVEITFFPDHQYTEKVSTAAAAGDLPDALDLDGPTVAQFVEADLLVPIETWFPQAVLDDFLPTIIEQGTINDTLYALGAFDSALVLYYDRTMLETAGVTAPDSGGWSWDDFMQACATLRSNGIDPVAMHMNETADEWYTYAFSPIVWSTDGRLISADGERVLTVLNTEENARVLSQWQRLFTKDFAATDPVDPNPFGSGKTAMDWSGHWMARLHEEAKGDALGVMPLPLPGDRRVAACGSWCWAVTSSAEQPANAAKWIAWVTDPVNGIKPIVEANGAVPARRSAFQLFPEYEREPYRLFRTLLEESGRPRPRTPHYPTLTQHFAAALRDIAHGADPHERLDAAAARVQQVINR